MAQKPDEKKHKKKSKNKLETSEHIAKKKVKKYKLKPSDEEEVIPKRKSVSFIPETVDNEIEPNVPRKMKRKNIDNRPATEEELTEADKSENRKNVTSKRQKKREKYEQLKTELKQKGETITQERALNYLSRWKHNKEEWKFEKLRQVWLQNHMFDSSAVPDTFFQTVVDYFGGSKGKIRQAVIDDCTKIIDAFEAEAEEKKDDAKFERARNLLQHLH